MQSCKKLAHENISGAEIVLDFESPATFWGIQKVFISWIICVCIKILKAWEMEIRWYNLARRLKATDDRIGLIRAGKIKIDSMLEKLDADLLRERSAALKKQPAPNEAKSLPEGKAISFPVMADFLREKFGKKGPCEKVPVPAAVPEKAAEPKVYASMKQRKKAERLARKHAAEDRVAAEKTAKSADTPRKSDAPASRFSEMKKNLFAMGMDPGAEEFSEKLLSKEVPLPVRA